VKMRGLVGTPPQLPTGMHAHERSESRLKRE
jgi:hypothetical protein